MRDMLLGRLVNTLPSGWLWKQFGELVTHSQNGISKRRSAIGNPTPVLRLADIREGMINESAPRDIKLSDEEVNKYVLRDGDLLCVRVNGSRSLTGRLVYVRTHNVWAYCDHFIRFRLKHEITEPKYVVYYFNTQVVRAYLSKHMVSTAGQNTVSQGTMLGVAVPVAPLDQQQVIVSELEKQFSRLDESIANLKRVKANLKRYKAAVLKAAVEGKLAPTAGPWKQVALGDVTTSIRNGYSKKPDAEQGTRIFRISAVRTMKLDTNDVRYLSGTPADYEPFLIEPGDVLFTRYNGNRDYVGVCARVPASLPPTVYPDKLIRVRVPSSMLLPEFLVILASTGRAREYIESKIRTTAGQSGISGGDLKVLPLDIPRVTEQLQIVAEVERRMSVVEELQASVQANLTRADRLRQTILSQAFSGRLLGQDTKHIPDILPTFSVAAESQARYGRDDRARR